LKLSAEVNLVEDMDVLPMFNKPWDLASDDGVYYIENLSTIVIVTGGLVSYNCVLPIGIFSVEKSHKKKSNPVDLAKATSNEVSEALFLKTVALLADKEKIDKLI